MEEYLWRPAIGTSLGGVTIKATDEGLWEPSGRPAQDEDAPGCSAAGCRLRGAG